MSKFQARVLLTQGDSEGNCIERIVEGVTMIEVVDGTLMLTREKGACAYATAPGQWVDCLIEAVEEIAAEPESDAALDHREGG